MLLNKHVISIYWGSIFRNHNDNWGWAKSISLCLNKIGVILIIVLLVKKPIDADFSALTENIESNLKARKFKVGDWFRITKDKNIFSKDYINNW